MCVLGLMTPSDLKVGLSIVNLSMVIISHVSSEIILEVLE